MIVMHLAFAVNEWPKNNTCQLSWSTVNTATRPVQFRWSTAVSTSSVPSLDRYAFLHSLSFAVEPETLDPSCSSQRRW